MFLGDSHTHSLCSPDGHFSTLDMAAAGRKAGLTYFCITDHCDLLTLDGAPIRTYNWAPYRAAVAEAEAHCPQGLELAHGLELGGAYEDPAAARAILAGQSDLDFIIGSVHNFRSLRNKGDFFFADYGDRKTCLRALTDYLGSLAAVAALPDCYDALGHILYPLRYMNAKHSQGISVTEGENGEQLSAVLRRIAEDGKSIEVNTWRGRSIAEWAPILRLYKSVGGEHVTVGSDAHITDDVGKGVREAYDLLKACGFDYVTAYRGRKARMERL